jgi:hypothetical protein
MFKQMEGYMDRLREEHCHKCGAELTDISTRFIRDPFDGNKKKLAYFATCPNNWLFHSTNVWVGGYWDNRFDQFDTMD